MSFPRFEVRLLGALEVSLDGEPVAIGTPRQRAVFARLLVAEGPVHTDQLVDQLWADHPPPRAVETIRVYVSRLRKALRWQPGDGVIDSVPGGYQLRRDRFHVDAEQFESLADRGLEELGCGDSDRAGHDLRRALALWRGSALADFRYDEFAQAEIARLGELRAQASWGVIEAALDRGRSREVLPELRGLVRRYPLREAMWEQLVVALVRSGQRDEAHRVYSEGFGILRRELGLAPELRRAAAVLGETTAAPTFASPEVLPPRPSPLVGRSAELRRVLRLLDRGCRLVTITGTGGIGKTRLAHEVAYRRRESLPDGVAVVPLHDTQTAGEVVGAVMDVVGVTTTDGQGSLANCLAGRRLLLVLDAVEHLGPAIVELVLDVLTTAPYGPTMLVTSRRRLGLDDEWMVALDGLDHVPRRAGEVTAAARLLRAAARRHGVRLDAADPAVERICQRVEGLPLAIILAASWLRLLDTSSVADHIDEDLAFLAGPAGPAGGDPQSVEAAIWRTWNLLRPEERDALGRLSFFQGAFSETAAREVAAVHVETLRDLADWSLLRAGPGSRLELHQLVRRFAMARGAEDAATFAAVQRAHAGHYLGLVARLTEGLGDRRQSEALAAIGSELSNVRAAWRWVTANRLDGLVETAVEGLFLFYEMRSRFVEGWEVMDEATEATEAASSATHQPALLATQIRVRRAFFAWRMGRYADAQTELTECMAMLHRLGNPPAESAFCTLVAGMTSLKLGMLDDASTLLRESLTLHERLGHRTGIWDCLENLAEVALVRDHLDEAARRYRSSLEASRAAGDRRGMAYGHLGLGTVASRRADWHSAIDRHRTAHRLFTALEDRDGMARALVGNAVAASGLGRMPACARHLGTALDLAREVGTRPLLHALAAGVIEVLDRIGNNAGVCELSACLVAEELLAPPLRARSEAGLTRLAASIGDDLVDRAVLRGRTGVLDELVGEAVTDWLGAPANVVPIATRRSGRA